MTGGTGAAGTGQGTTGAVGTNGVTPMKAVAAVMVGLLFFSLLSEVLENTLVRATASGPLTDMASYFAARNQPGVLAAKALFTALVAVLAGYVCGKIAGGHELTLAGVAALLQTGAFVYGFTMGEFASQTPIWMRVLLIVITGPGMIVGAWVRGQARMAGEQAAQAAHSKEPA